MLFKFLVVSIMSLSTEMNYFFLFFTTTNVFVIMPIQYNLKIHQKVCYMNQVNMLTIAISNIGL